MPDRAPIGAAAGGGTARAEDDAMNARRVTAELEKLNALDGKIVEMMRQLFLPGTRVRWMHGQHWRGGTVVRFNHCFGGHRNVVLTVESDSSGKHVKANPLDILRDSQ
jgi:hypothetical protein